MLGKSNNYWFSIGSDVLHRAGQLFNKTKAKRIETTKVCQPIRARLAAETTKIKLCF